MGENAGSYGQKTAKNMLITSYNSYGNNHGKLMTVFATIVICWGVLKQWK